MKNYIIGAPTSIKAKPMTLGAYNEYRGWEIPSNENPKSHGYLVEDPRREANHLNHENGITWLPADTFESTYVKCETTEEHISVERHEILHRIMLRRAFINSNDYDKLDVFNQGCIQLQDKMLNTYEKLLQMRLDLSIPTYIKPDPQWGRIIYLRDIDYSTALLFLKQGFLVARAGWNGKGQYLKKVNAAELLPGYDLPNPTVDQIFINTTKSFGSYVASQCDQFAEDWIVLGGM